MMNNDQECQASDATESTEEHECEEIKHEDCYERPSASIIITGSDNTYESLRH